MGDPARQDKHSLTIDDIELGEALKWDVFDAKDNLLLCKGFVIISNRQLESLIERGVYVDAQAYELTHPSSDEARDNEKERTPSALLHVKQAWHDFQALLADLENKPGQSQLANRIHAIAALLEEAIRINPDLILASMLFKQMVKQYALRHSLDAATIAILVAQNLGKPADEVRTIACAALTMNLGMLRLQDELQYSDDRPDEEQLSVIHQHPELSARILEQEGVSDTRWLDYVLHHHENVDGTGYPRGKAGESIPGNARLVSLADRYTAMLAPRAFREPLLPNEALGRLLLTREKAVDSLLVAQFIKTLGIYPPGMFVKLQSSETAIISHRGKNGAPPIAHSLIGPFGAQLPFPHKRDTSQDRYAIREAVPPPQGPVTFTMQQIWGGSSAS